MTASTNHSLSPWLKLGSAYLPPLAWALLIFSLSAQSSLHGLEISTLDFIAKKIAHMFVYAVLYFLFHRAFERTLPAKYQWLSWILPFVICFGYAISDEFHQSLVPGRYASSRDVGYDMLGATIAWLKIYKYV